MLHRPALCVLTVLLAAPAGAIVAGDPDGSPPDSPANRVDPNTDTSRFLGVASLTIGGTGLCTTSFISPRHVITAAHCVTDDNTGNLNVSASDLRVQINGSTTTSLGVSQITVNPTFGGFNNAVNDDLAILTLNANAPVGTPIYPIFDGPLFIGDTFTLVGYGQSGFGTSGYQSGTASAITKRVGFNNVDGAELDDEGSGIPEIYLYDFDGPNASSNRFGGLTLGNDLETTLGGGDSGGPAFIDNAGVLSLAAINTFVFSTGDPTIPDDFNAAPLFGSGGGGVLLAPYAQFIANTIPEPATAWVLLALLTPLATRRRHAG